MKRCHAKVVISNIHHIHLTEKFVGPFVEIYGITVTVAGSAMMGRAQPSLTNDTNISLRLLQTVKTVGQPINQVTVTLHTVTSDASHVTQSRSHVSLHNSPVSAWQQPQQCWGIIDHHMTAAAPVVTVASSRGVE